MDLNEFFSMIKSETSVKASANGSYQQLAFLDLITSDLIDIGDIQAFNDCNNPSYNGAHIHGFDIAAGCRIVHSDRRAITWPVPESADCKRDAHCVGSKHRHWDALYL